MAEELKTQTQADPLKRLKQLEDLLNTGNVLEKQLVDFITGIDTTTLTCDNVIALSSCLTKALTNERLTRLESTQVKDLLHWLQICLETNKNGLPPRAEVLRCVCAVLHAQPDVAVDCWLELFHPQHTRLLELGGILPSKDIECKSIDNFIETYVTLLMCMDAALSAKSVASNVTVLDDKEDELCHIVANALLCNHYEVAWAETYGIKEKQIPVLLLHTLQLMQKIITLCPAYAQAHASEIFGLAKEFLKFGINNHVTLTIPQKLNISQQMYDSGTDVEPEPTRKAGGKVPKVRKPRAVVKHRNHQQSRNQKLKQDNEELNQGTLEEHPEDANLLLLGNDMSIVSSESEMSSSSDNETFHAHGKLQDRLRKSQVRLAAIALLGTVARQLTRRTLYGYWHALFPINDNNCGTKLPNAPGEQRFDILHVGYSDPSVHCRSAALQVAAQMIYGSKQFLGKAACERRRVSASFMSFSTSLALSVRCMYKTLSFILASEASIPVLTQTLKCLAVLIQATPFEQLQMGFVCEFMPYVKTLTTSRDCTLQVASLMVMEFLISRPVLTEEIACLVGLPLPATKLSSSSMGFESFPNSSENDEIIQIDNEDLELLDSDIEEKTDNDEQLSKSKTSPSQENKKNVSETQAFRSSWLLLRVLDNLANDGQPLRGSPPPPTPVRIESLQVMVAISKHFTLFDDQLPRVCTALQSSLKDPLPDVRLYAGRCFDALSYQLSRYVIDKFACKDASSAIEADSMLSYVNFWLRMLNVIYEVYYENLQALKVCLCDAISNMGETIYERLPREAQTTIITFLSGCSSDDSEAMLVRAAAIRALAVFVLFPTLKSDLVFIENIAELTLRLTSNDNLNVRIKAQWALGNISDALIAHVHQSAELPLERISSDLLIRLTNGAIKACTDNDKVRANAVRSLGNLLRLFNESQLRAKDRCELMQRGFAKLIDCIRNTGNAKVTWNACYAVCRLMSNRPLIDISERLLANLYNVICQVIVRHSNFKVRINATAIILYIERRDDFGQHFEGFWSALIAAIEQSHNLDNYYEYNHRDNLHEQLCLAIAHMLELAKPDDFTLLAKKLSEQEEIVRNTWLRVINRMVPEKSAPLIACNALLLTKLRTSATLSKEQQYAVMQLAATFAAPI